MKTLNRHPMDLPVRGMNLLEIYRKMFLIRKVEEKVLELRKSDLITGSVHPCIGQESVPVGILASCNERDLITATYRGHGWALAAGVPTPALLGEIMGKATGTNEGRAGSPYLSAPEFGFVGENSIVGAGLPIANGLAMGQLHKKNQGVVVTSFGDGATNQGSSHEALVFAIARNLPVIFVCENNAWSEMTPISETVPHVELWQRAANYGVNALKIDGADMPALFAAGAAAVERARSGGGPTFLEVTVPRLLGHYNADIEHYRPSGDSKEHATRDPLPRLRELLNAKHGIDESALTILESEVIAYVEESAAQSIAAPLPGEMDGIGEVASKYVREKIRPLPIDSEKVAYGLAINKGLDEILADDANAVIFGEDIGTAGGVFGVTRNLRKKYGERCFDTPISEAAILGAAIGSSQNGLKPIVEIMWMDFLFVALDQIVNQASNVRYISNGKVTAPMVVRVQQGITPGSCAQHSQSMEAILAHIPGIKVGLPSNSHDAYQMLKAAVLDPDPVILIESRALYMNSDPVDFDAPIETLGGSRIAREGKDLAVITWGKTTPVVLRAAEEIKAEHGVDVCVVDLRWLNPLDEETIFEAVKSSNGKAIIVHEANVTGGFGAEISARISSRLFAELKAPVIRLGVPDSRIPASPIMQKALIPDVPKIVKAIRKLHAI